MTKIVKFRKITPPNKQTQTKHITHNDKHKHGHKQKRATKTSTIKNKKTIPRVMSTLSPTPTPTGHVTHDEDSQCSRCAGRGNLCPTHKHTKNERTTLTKPPKTQTHTNKTTHQTKHANTRIQTNTHKHNKTRHTNKQTNKQTTIKQQTIKP